MISIRKCFFSLFVFVASVSISQNKTNYIPYKSLFWEVTGNGLTKPSYLYGTMHVSSKMVFHLSDSVFMCLKNADAVGLETNPEVWLPEMEKDRSLYSVANSYYSRYYNGNFYYDAFSLNAPTNEDIASLLYSNSSLMNFLLYRTSSTNKNFEEDTYLDFFIYQSGRRLNKEIVSLEDFVTSREMADRSGWPDRNPKKDKNKKNTFRYWEKENSIDNAYRKGDLNALDSLQKLRVQSENYIKWLLIERNKIMVRNFDSIAHKKSLFSAVGAAHLPGAEGMIELLRAKGYTVRPIKFNDISESKLKKDIEKIKYPQTLKIQYAVDSSFSCNVPTKLIPVKVANSQNIYVAPDLPNGAFYIVQQLPHYGKLTEQSKDYLYKRLDSLIYENVPGKILTREKIKSNLGDEGVEIVNRTRSGDVQHSRIYVTANAFVLVKMSGTGEFVLETDYAKQFFDSFKFAEIKKSGYELKTPKHGGYSVLMPSKALFSNELPKGFTRYVEKWEGDDDMNANTYFVKKRIYYDYDYIEQDSFEVSMIPEFIAAGVKGDLISLKNAKVGLFPAKDFSVKVKDKNTYLHGRIIIRGAEYYVLGHYGTNKKADTKFFNSFKFEPYKYSMPYKLYNDTISSYKVKLIVKPTERSDGLFKQDNHFYTSQEYQEYDFTYIDNKVVHPETGEQVNISLVKLPKYYIKANIDSFWVVRNRVIGKDRSMYVANKKTYSKDGFDAEDMVLRDTCSSRIIFNKLIKKEGALYTLSFLSDTITKMTEFAETVFNSFTIGDTIFANDIFARKAPILLKDIYDEDSTKADHAQGSLNYFVDNFEQRDSSFLFEALKHSKFKTLPMRVKKQLIGVFEDNKAQGSVEILKQIYLENEDSLSLQLAVLKAMARQKTKYAYKELADLLITHTPLSDNNNSVSDIVYYIDDSLDLCNTIVDDLFELSNIPEYHSIIINLFARMQYKQILDSKVLDNRIKNLVNLTTLEIKRMKYKAAEEKNSYSNYRGGSNYVKSYLSFKNEKKIKYDFNHDYDNLLYDYFTLLMPKYKQPEVKSLFDKAVNINDPFLQVALRAMLLNNGVEVKDTIFDYYTKKSDTRLLVYAELKQANKLNYFDTKYLSLDSIAKAFLLYNEEVEKDTLVFDKKIKVSTNYGSGYVYFYKLLTEEGDDFVKALSFLPTDGKVPSLIDFDIQSEKYSTTKKGEYDKKVKALLYEIRTKKRQRAPSNGYDYLFGRD